MYALSSSRAPSTRCGGTVRLAASSVRRSATSPGLCPHLLKDRLDGLLRGLLSGKAGPLVVSALQVALRVQEVPFSLIHPVAASFHAEPP